MDTWLPWQPNATGCGEEDLAGPWQKTRAEEEKGPVT